MKLCWCYVALILTDCSIVLASVNGIFKLESPSGVPVDGMSLVNLSDEAPAEVTDSEGRAILVLQPDFDFVIKGTKPPMYQDLFIFGRTGSVDFNYTTYMGTRAEAEILARFIDEPYNASLGYIVVGMDNLRDPAKGLAPSNLEPAVGASALIDIPESGAPFIFDLRPAEGNTITEKSGSFVTFPNVLANIEGVAVSIAPNGQECLISPGLQDQSSPQAVVAFPDSVSVVSFICTSASAMKAPNNGRSVSAIGR
jgi:hypothetical protein